MRSWTAGSFLVLTIGLGVALMGCALATKAPPVANAGRDIIVHVGQEVTFDGSSSVDLDGGEIVYYQWKVTAAPEEREEETDRVLQEADVSVYTTDLAMNEDNVGQWTIELRVTDDEGQSATDEMKLTVIP
jgi:hypothetical protein